MDRLEYFMMVIRPNEQKMRIRTRLGGRITINDQTMAVRSILCPV